MRPDQHPTQVGCFDRRVQEDKHHARLLFRYHFVEYENYDFALIVMRIGKAIRDGHNGALKEVRVAPIHGVLERKKPDCK